MAADTVVVDSAVDQEFAQPVLKAYGERSGVRVRPQFDVPSLPQSDAIVSVEIH
jgi:hypothetical protein